MSDPFDIWLLENTTPQAEQGHVESTNILSKLPTFYREDAEVWFLQAEAAFDVNRIRSSLKKFQIVLAQLDLETARQVLDLARNPSELDPYHALKERLLSVYQDSENTRIRKLLEERQLGDLRPSQFLRELRRLSGSTAPEDIVRNLWLKGLPERMQAALAATDHSDLTKLAEIADKIAEVSCPYVNTCSPDRQNVNNLHDTVEELTKEIAALKLKLSNNPWQRSRSRSRNRQLCYYHSRFGVRARQCVQPCEWKLRKPQEN